MPTRPPNQLRAIARRVMGASGKGTWVRVLSATAEGKLVRGADGLDVGDRVRVELVHVDVERGFIDLARSEAA